MSNSINNAAKFAFFYMLSLVSLIFVSISLGMIAFQIINKEILDIINDYSGYFNQDVLKFAIAAIIIAGPIYYLTTRQIFKNLYSGELDKDSGVRKWLTYFIILVTTIIMLGWLIGTIINFLNGELTLKFGLKAFASIFIAAASFSFYLYDMKREDVKGKKDVIIRIYFYASLAIVIGAFVTSLFYVESPTQARARKLDDKVMNNLGNIESAINNYYSDEKKLPENLQILDQKYDYITVENTQDPVTKEVFGYKILNESEIELCANFRISTLPEANGQKNDYYNYGYYGPDIVHDKGNYCFKRKINTVIEPMEVKIVQ